MGRKRKKEGEKMWNIVLCWIATQICNFAVLVGENLTCTCRGWFYQPEEPKGFTDFIKEQNRK